MIFTSQNYPVSFKMLRQDLISKAIDIANHLFVHGFRENVVEMSAISMVKLMGGIVASGSRIHLVPHPKGWSTISPDGREIYFLVENKTEALIKARAKAKSEKLRLYIHSLAGNISDSESFVVNSPGRASRIWEEENGHLSNTSDLVQHRTREAIQKTKMLSQKIQAGLSLKNNKGVQNQLSLEY